MIRSQTPEFMDGPLIPQETVDDFHADLSRLGRILGNNREVVKLLRRNLPQSVLDVGCGQGTLLAEIRDTFGIAVKGVDLRPSLNGKNQVEILAADATRDPLPTSDLAVCILTVHHLDEEQVVKLVRNVGRSCSRFIILDLVRHRLPLVLFSIFLRPLISRLVFLDGQQSIRRAFTPEELRALVVKGIAGTSSTFRQSVSPIYGKQVIEISYRA